MNPNNSPAASVALHLSLSLCSTYFKEFSRRSPHLRLGPQGWKIVISAKKESSWLALAQYLLIT